jgi:Zn-finger nucleic acid-binding protein
MRNASHGRADKTGVSNCQNCGAPAELDESRGVRRCEHCGTEVEVPATFAHVELLSESARPCPLCLMPLSDGRLDGYPLLACPRCLGLLIEMKHFAEVIDAARVHESGAEGSMPSRTQEPGDRTLSCPQCRRPMLSHFYEGPGNLVIDSCERCFTNWLDRGELRRIARAPDGRD